MYDRQVTDNQLDKAQAKLREQVRNPKFELTRRSPEECAQGVVHFNDLLDEKRNLKRKLNPDEQYWMHSERALCRWDYDYWLTRYHRILSWEGNQIIHCTPTIAQSIVIDIKAEAEREGRAIMFMNLKARQLGITTEGIACIGHRVQFHHNVMAIAGSSTPDKSEKMFAKMVLSWELQPWWMMPKITTSRSGESALWRFGDQHSQLSIQHGSKMKADVGRGETPTMALISEVDEWLNPYHDIDSALIRAMHEHPTTFLQLESTAKRMHGYWKELWDYSTQYWKDTYQPARVQPVFLPWYVGTDLYPTVTWLKSRPIPADWKPLDITKKHAQKAAVYVQSDRLLSKYLGKDWQLPKEQQWYWEVEYLEHKAKNKLNIFFSELPADALEAFQPEQYSIFDAEVIHLYNSNTREPKAIYCLDGPSDEIRPELKPQQRLIDPNKAPLNIDNRYQLIPMRLENWPDKSPHGKFYLWELPEDGESYGLGVDTSQGLSMDASVSEVVRKASFRRVAAQVAEFASSAISAADLVPYVHCLARLYTVKNKEQQREQPKLVIETNFGAGDSCQSGLRKLGWHNFHEWTRPDKKDVDPSRATHLGFLTVRWSRDLILSWLIKAVRDLQLDIYSPYFVHEMRTLCKDENRQTIASEFGSHDDRIMAFAMVYFSLHYMETGEFRSPFGRSRIFLDQAPMTENTVFTEWKPPAAQQPVAATHDFQSELVRSGSWPEAPVYAERPPSPLETVDMDSLGSQYQAYLDYINR